MMQDAHAGKAAPEDGGHGMFVWIKCGLFHYELIQYIVGGQTSDKWNAKGGIQGRQKFLVKEV